MGTLTNDDLICNTNSQVSYTENGSWTAGNPTKVEIIDPLVKINSNPCTKQLLTVIPSGCTYTGYNFIAGVGTISPGGSNVSIGNATPMRKKDSGTCNGTFVQTSPPYSTISCNCDINYTDAGQSDVKST